MFTGIAGLAGTNIFRSLHVRIRPTFHVVLEVKPRGRLSGQRLKLLTRLERWKKKFVLFRGKKLSLNLMFPTCCDALPCDPKSRNFTTPWSNSHLLFALIGTISLPLHSFLSDSPSWFVCEWSFAMMRWKSIRIRIRTSLPRQFYYAKCKVSFFNLAFFCFTNFFIRKCVDQF